MDYYLPDVYSTPQTGLPREKERFLTHYLRLEKQRFLLAILTAFRLCPELQQVDFYTGSDESLDADLKVSPQKNANEGPDYWQLKAISDSMHADYVPELSDFCNSRTITRLDILNEDGSSRFSNSDTLLEFIERT